MTLDDRSIFEIPEYNLPKLEKEIARISKKAEKFGSYPFSPFVFGYFYRDNANGSKTKVYEVSLDIEIIKIDGWQFVARIDHSPETGNIVRTVPNVDLGERFRTVAPNCEHCNQNRARKDTFVFFNESTQEYKQVGSTCLNDFFGHDVKNMARIAEYAGYAVEVAKASTLGHEDGGLNYDYVGLRNYLFHCAAVCRTNGWVSTKKSNETGEKATRYRAWESMEYNGVVTDDDKIVADKALAWAQEFSEKETLNDYEHNILTIANSSVITARSCGLAASIVGVYLAITKPTAPVNIGSMEKVVALFDQARKTKKFPKININIASTKIVLTVAGDTARFPRSINVKSTGSYETAAWFGRIHVDGRFEASRIAPQALTEGLLAFAAAPSKIASQHGHETGSCCFCNRELTDTRSVEVGYGPVCADRWGLSW